MPPTPRPAPISVAAIVASTALLGSLEIAAFGRIGAAYVVLAIGSLPLDACALMVLVRRAILERG